MKIQRAYKTELDPSNVQRTALLRHCGAARWVYNWGLARKKEMREAGKKAIGAQKLDGELRGVIDADFAWLREMSKESRQSALADLAKAYKNFFDRCKKGKKGKATGFPKFKSRKKGIGSFRVYKVTVETGAIRLPRIGRVRLKESGYIPQGKYGRIENGVRIVGTTVTERAGRWFVSVQCEIEVPDAAPKNDRTLGVDFGIKTLATCSDGTTFQNPKALKAGLRKLKRLQRAVSRKGKGSTNRKKAVCRLAVQHARVSDARRHSLHHISHTITRKSSVVCVEDLNVQGMMKNHHLAQAIGDAGFGELRRQLEYKAAWRGSTVKIAPRFFPSSKTCSACGTVRETLKLSERVFRCGCGLEIDRDFNAAINLSKLAASRADNPNACGCESSGVHRIARETIADEAGSGRRKAPRRSPATAENGGAFF